MTVEVNEASEISETTEIDEVAVVSKAWKSLLRHSESSRFLNSII